MVWIPVVMLFDMVPPSRSPWWIVYGILMFLFSLVWADSIRLQVLKNAEDRNQKTCDPDGLLDTIEELLPLIKSKPNTILFSMDKASAMMQLGKYDDALRLLKENDVDTSTGITTPVKFIYYNNLACAYMKLGQLELVPFILDKSKIILDTMKNKPKMHRELNRVFQSTLAELKFHQHHFDEAYDILTKVDITDLHRKDHVNFSLLKAKILIAKNRPEEAVPLLHSVMEFGNKLHDTVEAKELLEQYGTATW